MRKEFPDKVRALAFKRSRGFCEIGRVHMPEIGCGRKLFTGDIRYEHIDPDGLTGEPTLENCAVLCTSCWKIKTNKYDIPVIAKSKRVERKHINARTAKGRPMAGTKRSGWRKRMSGQVEKW